jgi:hypothetical protein
MPLIQKHFGAMQRHVRPGVPEEGALLHILETVYHTSFLTEEKRRLSFSIIYATPHELEEQDVLKLARPIEFSQLRPFTSSEIMRLAPALKLSHVLICIDADPRYKHEPDHGLAIWGVINIGRYWSQLYRNEASFGITPPKNLVISCGTPGEMTASSGGRYIAMLRHGKVTVPDWGALNSDDVGSYFAASRAELEGQVLKRLLHNAYTETLAEQHWPAKYAASYIARILQGIKEEAHGGTVLFVRDDLDANDPVLRRCLDIKYEINYGGVWRMLQEFAVTHASLVPLDQELKDGEDVSTVRYQTVQTLLFRKRLLERQIQDSVDFIASLANVDGALVITDKYRVIGFGAEVIVRSEGLRTVRLDEREMPIASFGTRHRSTFRFCYELPDSVAFILSSDGGVKFAKRVGDVVQFWNDADSGIFGV